MTKFRALSGDEIDCRVSTISEKGCSLLLYKDARCDMNILDETVGAENWQRRHYEVKGNLHCEVSIWDAEKKQWISKADCGTESNTEKEKGGNEPMRNVNLEENELTITRTVYCPVYMDCS